MSVLIPSVLIPRRRRSSGRRPLTMLAVCTALLLAAVPARAQEDRFTALAANLSNVGPSGATGTVDITIDRYSTEEERNRFLAVLAERGPDALLEAFRKAPSIGRLSTPGNLGYEIRFAHAMPGEDGGRRIVVATDRRISLWEARNQPRTIEYPFTVLELRVNAEGRGEGKAAIFTKIDVDKRNNTIILEDFANQPVQLLSVRSTKDER